ncbi:C39 family peptidase [Anaerolactibacter massiliensis]|uniref:C39 family peptidase n=1 Tax=Anaerolactibacter massiliensis TaxID=2044573 RepID=UPI000CF9D9CD|nr:C39 family peptidase [Anaerolactibacter massiliensis]
MKRFLEIILSLLIGISTCMTLAFARDYDDGNGDDCPSCFVDTEPNIPDETAIAEYQYKAAHAAEHNSEQALKNPFKTGSVIRARAINASVTSQAWANSGIVRYYQTDYSDYLCPKTSTAYTIASDGCVVTSFAMVVNKFGIYATPVTVKNRINADGPGTTSGCNFPWTSVNTVSPYNTLKIQNITSSNWNTAYDNIEGALLSNRPVIIYMHGSSGYHAVVVYGYEHYSDGGEYHYIFNPDPRNASHQTSLEEYRRDGWTVERIMVYYK